jgi:hypothetical protein
MSTIRLPKGVTVTTFPQPPANFDPLLADQATLQKYGHPRRHDENPELLRRWKKLFGKKLQAIEPKFQVMENMRHGKRLPAQTTDTSTNWSGCVASPTTGSTFVSVAGQWIVPNPTSGGDTGATEYSSSWIGIDGDGSSDVFQAGSECDFPTNIYAWSEWFPNYSVQIMNFPVSAGDTLTCSLSVSAGSNTSGLVVFRNETQNTSTSFQIQAPSGTTLVGNCAEWIVERPEVSGGITNLPDYGVVTFSEAYGGTSANTVIQASAGNLINMTDGSGNTISSASFTPPDVTCTFI